jgi:hypothetical protein
MSELSNKIYKFLANSKLNYITTVSVVFLVMEDNPFMKQEELSEILKNAIEKALKIKKYQDIEAQNKLNNIFKEVFIKNNY